MLKIKSLYINNFKAFNDFHIEFNENMTVMIGFNGTGKTTILEIIYNILSQNFNYFLKYKEFTFIEMEILQEGKEKIILVQKENNAIKIKVNGKMVESLEKNMNLSKILYIPTEVNFLNIETKGVSKLEGEEDKNIVLNSERMSKQLKQFLVNEKYKDLNDIAEGKTEKAIRLEKFKKLYNDFFDDKEFIGIDNETFEPQFKIKENGKIIKVEDLSAGEKQIFFRGGSLLQNSNKGVLVLLDEPEISMHPEWQQKILDFYKNISEEAQYIISTHSPHIAICSLPKEIRVLEKDENKIVIREITGSYGRTVEDVLTSIFELETLRNEEMENNIKEYRELFFNKNVNSDEQNQRLKELESIIYKYLDPNDPAISMLEFENGTMELKEKLKKLVGEQNA